VIFYWLADTLGAETARRFAREAFAAFFVGQREVGAAPVLAELVQAVGGDGAATADVLGDAARRERVAAASRAAADAGVFGSPYVVVDGEPFWGFDRLPQVERWLATGGW